MKDISTVNFIKIRLENPREYHHTDHMDLSRPCILILGGENTNMPEWAKNYYITLAKTLYMNNIDSGLDIYSIYYKFRDRNPSFDRLNLFREFRDTKSLLSYSGGSLTQSDIAHLSQDYPLCNEYPNYIYDIFNFAFMPRLISRCGQMLPPKKIKENFRNMIVFTHCHGTYVLRMLEKHMNQEFNKFTYSLQDLYTIQKNLFVINHAPFAPLEKCKFTSLSFGSASDIQVGYYNELDYHMKTTPKKFKTAFYGPAFGNIVITDKIKRDPTTEHSQVGLSGDVKSQHELTASGQILFAIERNALLTGTRAMLAHKPIPTIAELISTEYADFTDLQTRAQQICRSLGIKSR